MRSYYFFWHNVLAKCRFIRSFGVFESNSGMSDGDNSKRLRIMYKAISAAELIESSCRVLSKLRLSRRAYENKIHISLPVSNCDRADELLGSVSLEPASRKFPNDSQIPGQERDIFSKIATSVGSRKKISLSILRDRSTEASNLPKSMQAVLFAPPKKRYR